MIDITFDVYSDTPISKDPDSSSKTLREYHKILWSKELSNGISFELDTNTKQLLHHKSSLGEFYLSSDSICNTYSKAKNMQDIVKIYHLMRLINFINFVVRLEHILFIHLKKSKIK